MRWQYPAKVEPLVTSQPNNTRESWKPVHPDRIVRPTTPAAHQLAKPLLDTITGIERSAWGVVAPDRYRILPALPAALQPCFTPIYTAAVAIVPTAFPTTFPDRLPPPRLRLEAATQTWVDSQATPTRTWRAVYPDLLRRRWTPDGRLDLPIDPQATTPLPAVSGPAWLARQFLLAGGGPAPIQAQAAVPTQWPARYPDQIDRPSRAAALAPTVATDFRSPLLTPLGWQPTYPERVVRPWLRAAQQQTTGRPIDIVWVSPSPDRAWAPLFPDRIDRRTVHASAVPFFTAGTSLQLVGAVSFSYPDDLPAKPWMHASRQQAWAAGSQLVLTATPLVAPTFPAILPRRPWRPRDLAPGSLENFPSVVPFFGWRGYQPSAIDRRTFAVARQQAWTFGNQATKTVVGLSWQGRYPDQLLPARRVAWQFPGWVNLDPIPNPPSPALAWKNQYPDAVRRAETLRAALQQVAPADTRLRPESPLQAWAPAFPDTIARLRLPAAATPFQFVQITFPAPDPGRWWQGSAPSWLPAIRRPIPPGAQPFDRTAAISPYLPPSAPDWIARAARPVRGERLDPPTVLQTLGALVPTTTAPAWFLRPSALLLPGVQLVVPILAPICVCLDRTYFLAAAFVDEDLRLPAFDAESWIAAGFVDDGPGCGSGTAGIPPGAGSSTGSVGGGLGGTTPPPIVSPPPAPPPTDPGGAGSGLPIPTAAPTAVLSLATLDLQSEDPVPENRAVTTAAGLTQALADAAAGILPAGSIITLAPGIYDGSWTLPVHPGTARITITTAGPIPLRRLTLADLPQLAILRSTVASVSPIVTAPGAHGWRLVGLGVTQTGGNTFGLIRLGADFSTQQTLADVPYNLEIDRCVCYVDDATEERRGIALNAGSTVIRRSTISNIKDEGSDSQAIGGWNGPGPYLIDDCFLEGEGENLLFGGDTAFPGCTPSDITITNCDITKRPEWQGVRTRVKNLLELKHAQRVRVAGNRFSHCWLSAQDGFAIVLTVANQNGDNPQTTVRDITIEDNTILDVGSGIDLSGLDPFSPCLPMERVIVRNNLVHTDPARGGEGLFALILNGPDTLTIDHNTVLHFGSFLRFDAPAYQTPGFRCVGNVGFCGTYGIIRDGGAQGSAALDAYFSDWVFTGNVIGGLPDAGINPTTFPATNQYPTTAALQAAFVDYAHGQVTFPAGSPYTGAGYTPIDVLAPATSVTVSTIGTMGSLVAGTLDWGDGSAPLVWAGAPQSGYDHTYGGPGTYLIVLTVTDDQARSATATLAVSVS